ncbi:MAG: DUF3226 domain-containing protein [Isosphaeraceae bacterium]
MADRFLLVVEGPDDLHVISNLMMRHQFQPKFKVSNEEGYEKLISRISPRLKPGTDLERFGVIVDADADIQARWRQIKGTLERAGYNDVPDAPDPAGAIIHHEDLPRVGVWIMPDNTVPGMLEDYLCFLVPEGDILMERARRCVEEIPVEERRFIAAHFTKAWVHTWLAWQDDPGTPLGQAITKRYFESDGPQVQALLDWLTRLFA